MRGYVHQRILNRLRKPSHFVYITFLITPKCIIVCFYGFKPFLVPTDG